MAVLIGRGGREDLCRGDVIQTQPSSIYLTSFKYCEKVKAAQPLVSESQKKSKTPSIRKFFFGTKGRRKEKEAGTPTPEEEKLYLDDQYAREKVIDSDLQNLVTLPQGVDYQEWLASHTLSFFEHVNLMYGAVSEFCTAATCPSMAGPGNTQYYWFDERGKKSKCIAPQYVDYVMSSIQKTVYDEQIFPTKYGNPFPQNLLPQCRRMHLWLLHVLAHIYACHYKEVLALKLHPHLNTLAEHFLQFNSRFSLLEVKDTEVLSDLYDKLLQGPLLTVLPGDDLPRDDLRDDLQKPAADDEPPEKRAAAHARANTPPQVLPPPEGAPEPEMPAAVHLNNHNNRVPGAPADPDSPPDHAALMTSLSGLKHESGATSAAVAMVTDQSDANKENLASAHEPKRSL